MRGRAACLAPAGWPGGDPLPACPTGAAANAAQGTAPVLVASARCGRSQSSPMPSLSSEANGAEPSTVGAKAEAAGAGCSAARRTSSSEWGAAAAACSVTSCGWVPAGAGCRWGTRLCTSSQDSNVAGCLLGRWSDGGTRWTVAAAAGAVPAWALASCCCQSKTAAGSPHPCEGLSRRGSPPSSEKKRGPVATVNPLMCARCRAQLRAWRECDKHQQWLARLSPRQVAGGQP